MNIPYSRMTQTPEVDFIISRLANVASMDAITLGGSPHPNRSANSIGGPCGIGRACFCGRLDSLAQLPQYRNHAQAGPVGRV